MEQMKMRTCSEPVEPNCGLLYNSLLLGLWFNAKGWKFDGTPDFGEPVPDGPLPQ
jgi:hypothetical protein